MIRTVVGVVFAAAVAFGMATTRGGELGSEIDLSTFGESQSKEPSSIWEDMNLEEVGLRGQVARMVGPGATRSLGLSTGHRCGRCAHSRHSWASQVLSGPLAALLRLY